MIDGETFVAATANPEQENEYMILGISLAEGQTFTLYDNVNEAAWTVALDEASQPGVEMAETQDAYVVTRGGRYDLYITIAFGQDKLYVASVGYDAVDAIYSEGVATKIFVDGIMYIIRDGKMFNVAGEIVR